MAGLNLDAPLHRSPSGRRLIRGNSDPNTGNVGLRVKVCVFFTIMQGSASLGTVMPAQTCFCHGCLAHKNARLFRPQHPSFFPPTSFQVVLAYTVALAAAIAGFWVSPDVAAVQWLAVAAVGAALYGDHIYPLVFRLATCLHATVGHMAAKPCLRHCTSVA